MKEQQGETRRHLLGMLTAMAGAVLAPPSLLLAQQAPSPPQPLPSPNAPMNQNVPGGLDGSGLAHQPRPSTISPLMWTAIKSDTDKLLEMVTDFKTKVDQTNLTATLPLPLIKEAHQIEKMAKEIQSRMKS
jgi:hypothetical protein